MELSRETGLPLVATNDSHYTVQTDAPIQDIMICIQTNTTVQDEKRLRMEDNSYYMRSHQEMAELFSDLPEAVENSQRIAEKCNVTIDFGVPHIPEFVPPEGEDADAYLSRLCREGLRHRFGRPSTEVQERLEYELDVIRKTRFSNYFLVVWDIASFVHQRHILFGVRGSAAASLALYCLGVTDIDPLEHRLVFERFLNLERKEMPDIDMDFQDDRRDEVLAYVSRKYGQDRVAQIVTFGTLGPKAAIRDVGRVLGMSYADTDRIARMIPFRAKTLDEALQMAPELQEALQADESIQKLMDTAKGVEGVAHHASTHAAGVVISQEPLAEYVPLQRPIRGSEQSDLAMTQYAMAPIAKLGLLKMDFLGLINLSTLDRTMKLLERTRGLRIDLHEVPLDDRVTFELLGSGKTTDIFQLESPGMQRYIKELKPSSLRDVSAMIALYRPGPMEHIDTFINAKYGRVPIKYPHPALKEILEETYGVIVYQDQVLLIARAFAGYTLGEADIVRKAMGKKIPEVMRKEREKFIAGAVRQGFDKSLAEEVFNLIEPFAGYAFNKAHSVSYALIAYWTAYFKANYPVEYMASVLNSRLGNLEKSASTISECFRLGTPVLLPDVNHSGVEFSVEADEQGRACIRFGLAAIKNVGASAVAPVVQAREEGGPFKSVEELCRRVDPRSLNRRILESLVKAGALDSLGVRGALLASLDRILALAQKEARLKETGQSTMFDLFGQQVPTPLAAVSLEGEDALPSEKVAWEKELLGVALSENPFSALALDPDIDAISSRDQLTPDMEGQQVRTVGQLSSVSERMTKKGRPFVSASLELLGGPVEVLAWPDVLERTRELWQQGAILLVVGKVKVRDDEISIYCDEVERYEPRKAPPAEQAPGSDRGQAAETPREAPRPPVVVANGKRIVVIKLVESGQAGPDAQLLQDVLRTCLEFPGSDRVQLEIRTNGKRVLMDVPIVTTSYSPELHRRLDLMLGPGRVALTEGTKNGNGNHA